MFTCPKCQGALVAGAAECPHCGVVLAKIAAVSDETWQIRSSGKQYGTDSTTLKQWIGERRIALTDQVMAPGGQWALVQEALWLLVPVTTGTLDVPCETIDAIFAIGSHTYGGLFGGGADPNLAFNGVKQQLRTTCLARGGDAVINCEFEYRVAVSAALLGMNQSVEIFAYGTAVRFKPRAIPEQGSPA